MDQKEKERIVRKCRKKVEEAELMITELENQLTALEERFSNGETDNDLYIKHSDTTKKLENAMSLWELACTELAKLENSN